MPYFILFNFMSKAFFFPFSSKKFSHIMSSPSNPLLQSCPIFLYGSLFFLFPLFLMPCVICIIWVLYLFFLYLPYVLSFSSSTIFFLFSLIPSLHLCAYLKERPLITHVGVLGLFPSLKLCTFLFLSICILVIYSCNQIYSKTKHTSGIKKCSNYICEIIGIQDSR